MITIKKDIDLKDFEAWSGGATRLNDSFKNGTYDQLNTYVQDYVNNLKEGTCIDETELNDLLWFDDYVQEIVYAEE